MDAAAFAAFFGTDPVAFITNSAVRAIVVGMVMGAIAVVLTLTYGRR